METAKPIAIIFYKLRDLVDVINCEKFHVNRLRGFWGSPIGKRYRPYHTGKHCRAAVLMATFSPFGLGRQALSKMGVVSM
jgi:hypothetical protein